MTSGKDRKAFLSGISLAGKPVVGLAEVSMFFHRW
jgi:hypothetical protein